jgi:hypothetical protein
MKILVIVFIIAAVAAGGFLLKGYFDQTSAAKDLEAKIDSDTRSLKVMLTSNQSLAQEIDDLKDKQAAVQKSLADENTVVPPKMNSNEIVGKLLEAGKLNSVSVIPLTTTDWTSAKVLQSNYWVFKAKMELNGSADYLVHFLKYIQDSLYPTLVIESLDMTQYTPTPLPNQVTSTPTESMIRANIAIAIYAR